MEIQKKIEDIAFGSETMYGETMEVSEPIVMASAAGWYVGKICKGKYGIEPYDRFTDYFVTPEEAFALLKSFRVWGFA